MHLCVQDSETCDSLTAGIMNAVDAKMSKSRKRLYNDWCQAVFQNQGGVLSKHAEAIEAVSKDDATTTALPKQEPLLASARKSDEPASRAKREVIEPKARPRALARQEARAEAHVTQSALRKAIDESADSNGAGFEIATGIEGVAIAEKATKVQAVSSEMDSAEDSLDKALGAAKKMSKKHRRHHFA